MGKFKHGEGRRSRNTPEYSVWLGIRRRCLIPSEKCYANYGGRGITICARWLTSYVNFLADMGRRPSPKHTIERKDNEKGYSPDNCTWATYKEQNNNRRDRVRPTHCDRGHPLEGDNEYVRPDGKRGCRTCRRQNMRDYYARKKEAA